MSERLTKREIELLHILSETKGFAETETICEKMDIRPRTLRECVRGFRDARAADAGVDIEARPGAGYRLKIIDQDKYYTLLKEIVDTETNSQFLMPSDQNERISYIIRTLLTANDYIRSEELADRLYISRSTFSEDLRQVKEQLALFDLQVEAAPRQGIRIAGDEFHIRNAIAEFCFDTAGFDNRRSESSVDRYFGADEYETMRSLLYETLKKYDFTMADASFRNLIIHLLIALTRIEDGTYIGGLSGSEQESLKEKPEWQIAADIYRQLSEVYGLEIPETEIGYVTIHLLGKKMIASEKEMVMYPETLNTLSRVMKQINARYGYDFSGDIELYSALAMHMEPLIERARYGMHINNPLLGQINRENPLAFDIAAMTAKVLQEEIGMPIDKNEIGYLALHFALAIERQKSGMKKKILVVCASGAGTSRMLAYKIQRRFQDTCESVDTMSYYDLKAAGSCEYDMVLSTVPIDFVLNVPVIRIKEIPDAEDLEKVDTALHTDREEYTFVRSCFDPGLVFANADLHTPEEVIAFLSRKLSEKVVLDSRYQEMVLERERMASTAIGHMAAFPHPGRACSDVTKVAALSLKDAIDWYGTRVRLVFLTTMQRNGDEKYSVFAQTMADLITDRQLLSRLLQEMTYEQIMDCIQQLYQQPQEEDIFQ